MPGPYKKIAFPPGATIPPSGLPDPACARTADVFVFWARVPADVDLSGILPRLDEAERAQAARFHFTRDRNAYAVAHALLRGALDRIGGARSWRFRPLPGGKPVIDGADLPQLHFSLSHTRPLTAVAIGRVGPLGVDVEAVARTQSHEDVAGLAFAPQERALLRSLEGDRWRETFFTLWTLKEAAIKATGQGLSAELPAFAFALDPPRLQTPGPDGSDRQDWSFHAARVVDCRLAAAVRAGPGRMVAFHLSEIPIVDLQTAPLRR